jgi:hypothetical protein
MSDEEARKGVVSFQFRKRRESAGSKRWVAWGELCAGQREKRRGRGKITP